MKRGGRRRSKSLLAVVAANVRRRRQVLGLSQEAFAELSGYHRTYVSAIERGERNITLSTLGALAAALKVDVLDLFERADE